MNNRPDILYIMTDQQRFDTIAAMGNDLIYTPNLDRLVRRGVAFTRGYSTCPVCVPARYTVRTGCEPPRTRVFTNGISPPAQGQAATITERCGAYLPQVMQQRGYRTFGIGKFHTRPWNEPLGYEVHLHSEEMYGSPQQRQGDAYASWIAREHPAFNYIEALMGERTEMYYMPQVSPMPAELTVERWAAERAVEQIGRTDDARPYFGFVSFIGPHPPFAPPVPFNRLYDPDRMPSPVRGDIELDHMDEQIPEMNHKIWAGDISDERARVLKARYYGEITYIDDCLGRLLDAVEAGGRGDDTLICFFADHGDHLGDHHAWQKESFFEASCHVPYLVSWPARLPADVRRDDLVTLTDLFAIATAASGEVDPRDGHDVIGMLGGTVPPRDTIIGMHGQPGTRRFKIMVRDTEWKYIYMSNGGRRQLFRPEDDPDESVNLVDRHRDTAEALHRVAANACDVSGAREALDDDGRLRRFEYTRGSRDRIYQFDHSRGVSGFPDHPAEVLRRWKQST